MHEDRRLAAIMFTDIVGYTALMGSDEDKAFDMLARNHTIHATLIKKYNGKLIKEIGDGTLASFPLASNAVRCAMDIQKEAKSLKIPLKIGIHEGEMVFAGADVLGDGVNVASRLQELSQEGCITISGTVQKDIKNKADIITKFVGDKKLKNVDDPVKVYEVLCEEEEQKPVEDKPVKSKSKYIYFLLGGIIVILIAVAIWQLLPTKDATLISEETEPVEIDRSIAVLPFANLSDDPEQEYFSDGIMDEILMHLYKIGDLRVTSRTSVMGYKGTTKKIKEIAEELGVVHILEGSVRKSGNKVRIIVQLIDPSKDQHLWAESYDRELADVFVIQSEVAQKIAIALKAIVSPDVKERMETNPTDNLIAYDYYLKGNDAYWRSWTYIDKSIMYESIDYYEKAIESDENFSMAFTGLGRSYWRLAQHEPAEKKPELMKNSKSNLKKAIDLDPYNGWAYAEMSVVTINWDWDSTATRHNLEMAIKLMPNDFNAYIHSFYFEGRLGNCQEMKSIQKEYKRFNQNVDHPFTSWSLLILFCERNYSEIAKRADQYWDGYLRSHQVYPIFFSYLLLDEYDKANKIVSYVRDSINAKWMYYMFNGILKAKQGYEKEALNMCDSLRNTSLGNSSIAFIFAALNDKKQMYNYLHKALDNREAFYSYIDLYPEMISCENDAEFQNIKKEIWIPRE